MILTSFEKALKALDKVIKARAKDSENEFLLDAATQRFEFTYELSHKFLKRYLEIAAASEQEYDKLSFPDLIRTGVEKGLLKHGWEKWQHYRAARNATSHTYDERKAEEIYKLIPEFYEEACFLLHELQQRLNNDDK